MTPGLDAVISSSVSARAWLRHDEQQNGRPPVPQQKRVLEEAHILYLNQMEPPRLSISHSAEPISGTAAHFTYFFPHPARALSSKHK